MTASVISAASWCVVISAASWCVSEKRRVVMSSGGFTNSDLTCRGQLYYRYKCATSSKLGNPVLKTLSQTFLTLIPGNPPKVVSPLEWYAAAVGSTVLPAYNAQGGPLGKGHVRFDRTQTQYLDGGARTFNIASNGGFTVVAVVRFRGSPGFSERVVDFGNGAGDNNIVVSRKETSSDLILDVYEGGNLVCEVSGSSAIVQDQWMAIVARYRAQDRNFTLVVNGQLAGSTTANVALTDKTLNGTYVGRSHWNHDYFNGDIAGLYVNDEYASDEKSALIADALKEGLDLTELPCNNCQSRNVTTHCSAHVTNLDGVPEGNNIQYLDRHNVQCPANKVSPPTCCDDCS